VHFVTLIMLRLPIHTRGRGNAMFCCVIHVQASRAASSWFWVAMASTIMHWRGAQRCYVSSVSRAHKLSVSRHRLSLLPYINQQRQHTGSIRISNHAAARRIR